MNSYPIDGEHMHPEEVDLHGRVVVAKVAGLASGVLAAEKGPKAPEHFIRIAANALDYADAVVREYRSRFEEQDGS